VFWGIPALQGLHIGFFVAVAMLVVFWIVLNRTTLGYEVRAVGYNPDAAAYGGIKVRTNYLRAMAISGGFAGLAGGIDMLGYLHHYGTIDVQARRSFLGTLSRCSDATLRWAGLAALPSAGSPAWTTHGSSRGRSTRARLPPDGDHPGPRRALRRRRRSSWRSGTPPLEGAAQAEGPATRAGAAPEAGREHVRRQRPAVLRSRPRAEGLRHVRNILVLALLAAPPITQR
jgi:hypothetical protein